MLGTFHMLCVILTLTLKSEHYYPHFAGMVLKGELAQDRTVKKHRGGAGIQVSPPSLWRDRWALWRIPGVFAHAQLRQGCSAGLGQQRAVGGRGARELADSPERLSCLGSQRPAPATSLSEAALEPKSVGRRGPNTARPQRKTGGAFPGACVLGAGPSQSWKG